VVYVFFLLPLVDNVGSLDSAIQNSESSTSSFQKLQSSYTTPNKFSLQKPKPRNAWLPQISVFFKLSLFLFCFSFQKFFPLTDLNLKAHHYLHLRQTLHGFLLMKNLPLDFRNCPTIMRTTSFLPSGSIRYLKQPLCGLLIQNQHHKGLL